MPTRCRAASTASACRSSTRFSEWLDLTIWRDGEEHFMRFRHGDAEAPLKVVGKTDKRGTRVTFLP